MTPKIMKKYEKVGNLKNKAQINTSKYLPKVTPKSGEKHQKVGRLLMVWPRQLTPQSDPQKWLKMII